MMRNMTAGPGGAMVLILVLGQTSSGQPLPDCTIDFEVTCPNAVELCGATFNGGFGCVFAGLANCYSSGLQSYGVTAATPLTIMLSGDLTSLQVFFANQGVALGTMRFFDAVVGGNEVAPPMPTNGDCLAIMMPPLQLVSFSNCVRRIEVTATGGTVWIDDFRVNPLPPFPDCNGNCTADDEDIANGTSLDCDGDNIPDECEFPGCVGILLGDMNCDGQRDGADIRRFVGTLVSGGYTCQADMNQDGAVDTADVPALVNTLLAP